MHFPHTRHFQRYEYVLEKGYVKDKVVMDVGAGTGYGSSILGGNAKMVFAVEKNGNFREMFTSSVVVPVPEDFYNMSKKVDVCVAIEVFEHMLNPRKFVRKLAEIGEYVFLTTPLAKVTGRTRNPVHVAEYSKEDFEKIVEEEFEILDRCCQKSNLDIVARTSPNGCSYDGGHVVQMLWARSRNGR